MRGSTWRVAVIGAGPSGLCAAQTLLAEGISVDVIDRLAAPYGLVRYGVAPDHIKMKSVIRALREPFTQGDAHFFGNVMVGRDVLHQDLRDHYHAVVYATGSSVDRSLGVPGENLDGVYGSGEFVRWYCGHPDLVDLDPSLDDPNAVVVGAGNVALDIARVLAKSAEELRTTDVTDRVLSDLRMSRVRDIHLLIRRGPDAMKFTPQELRPIGELANADIIVHDGGLLDVIDVDGLERRQRQNIETLRTWVDRPPEGKPRRIHLRFLRSPIRMEGDGSVNCVVAEENTLKNGQIVPTGQVERIDAGLVITAIGYEAERINALPFDEAAGIVPNEAGRVVSAGSAVPDVYVTGWLKRGPSGVIGTNKSDAAETARVVIEDLSASRAPKYPDREHLRKLLAGRGVRYVDWSGWLQLDAEEERLGSARGAERIKVAERASMLDVACRRTA